MENGILDEDDGKQLWSRILGDVQSNVALKLPSHKNLLVIGDVSSGKTSLIGRLQNVDNPKRGHGIEYHYLDVKDQEREEECKLGVWVLDGDAYHQNLLKFALTNKNFADTLVVLVGSIDTPWLLLESLQQWIDILTKYVDRLGLDADELSEYRESLIRQFQDYTEPETDAAQQPILKRVANPLHPPAEPDKVQLPLPDGCFTNNIGLPIVVVITKSDTMTSALEKEFDYKEEHFDFIQYHLRMFCLKYGASLFYTSIKEDKNCDLLRSYLLHRIYGFHFQHAAYVVEHDSVFIPSGWDNPTKAYLLAGSTGGLVKDLTNTNYSEVISRPASLAAQRRPAAGAGGGGGGGAGGGGVGGTPGREPELPEDEQMFLCRLQANLLKQSATPSGQVAGPPGTGGSGAGGSGGGAGARAGQAKPGVAGARGGPGGGRAGAGAGGLPGAAGGAAAAAAAGQGAAGMGANDGVLANFFNSLLSKKSGQPGGAPGGGAPTGAGAAAAAAAAAGNSAPAKLDHNNDADADAAAAAADSPDAAPVKRVAPATPAQS